jgi:cell division protein FtsZ
MLEKDATKINIHVIGVGGCGGNAISNMSSTSAHSTIRFSSINTDISALNQCQNLSHKQSQEHSTKHEVVLIGEHTTKGFGAGANPDVAKHAAEHSIELLKALIADDTLIIVIAGLGGGTGSGATSVLLDLASEMGIDALCFVTLPFKSEGDKRKEIAYYALEEIKRKANATLVLSNDALITALDATVGIISAFRHCDTQMQRIVESIITMLTSTGYINVDINDFSHILSLEGDTALGVGVAHSDETLCDALTHALKNPLVQTNHIKGTQGVIVQLSCQQEPSLAMYESMLAELQTLIDSSRALIISGVTISEELPHFAEVLVIATGIPPDAQSEPTSEKIVEMKRPRLSQPYNGKSEYLDTPTFVRLKGKG